MNITDFRGHPTDEVWERYSMKKLAEAACASLEEHVLRCEACQVRLEQIDDYVRVMKCAAARDFPRPPGHPMRIFPGALRPYAARAFQSPRPIIAVGIAAMILFFALPVPPRLVVDYPVTLTAVRGTTGISHAPARARLTLTMDVTEIAQLDSYRLEMVDRSGKSVWNSVVSPHAGRILATVPRVLLAGTYWVRLYTTTPKSDSLLREYGLELSSD